MSDEPAATDLYAIIGQQEVELRIERQKVEQQQAQLNGLMGRLRSALLRVPKSKLDADEKAVLASLEAADEATRAAQEATEGQTPD